MNTYKLLTPGPLTTTDTVKEEMLVDRCTWDDDYKAVTQKIRRQLLQLGHVSEDDYTVVLMQGSGTFGVESVLSSVVGDEDKVVDFKQAQLQSVMNRVIATALRENKDIITTSIKEEVTADVMRQFDAVMREKDEREEARYRRLDTVLREIQ